MQENQIISEIIRYLSDENYHYAVLIDGDWGCGKTYFVLNELRNAIENYEKDHNKREIKYISLYGCKTIEEVEESIYWSIIDEKFFEFKDRLSREAYGNEKKKKDETGRKIWSVSKKLISLSMQKFGLSNKNYSYIEDFINLSKYIFIFDDIERCNCEINSLLGYINGFVEHEGIKVILVANEDEIGSLSQDTRKELQYLVAAQEEIKIPKKASIYEAVNAKTTSIPELNVEELERRRNILFAEKEYDEEYKRIREKLVGVTLHYQPDFAKIMHLLIHSNNIDGDLQKILDENVQYYLDKMKEVGHHNLRTFQFFLSKIEYIYENFKKVEISKKYFEKILDFVVQNCFMLCVEFKANVEEPEDEILKIMYRSRWIFHSLDVYIKEGRFEQEEFIKDIHCYLEDKIINKLDPDDPYSKLNNEYHIRTQKWDEEQIREILKKLEENEYPLGTYRNILILFVKLKKIGFDAEILNKAMETMIINIKSEGVVHELSEDVFMIEDKQSAEECKRLLSRINHEVRETATTCRQKTIVEMIANQDDWAKQIKEFISSDIYTQKKEAPFLNQVSVENWVEVISNSDAENIQIFRECLDEIFGHDIIRKSIYEDMSYMEDIIERLQDIVITDDLIRRLQLSWLIEQMKSIHHKHTVEYVRYYQKL